MRCLSEKGICVVSLTELVDTARENAGFQNPTVCLTFDDGHISNFTHAFPVLQQFGYPACFFITVDEIGSRRGLLWRQVRTMAEEGMEIGSHGLTHIPMAFLNTKELIHQLRASKQILEDALGKPVKFFASPTGYSDARLQHFVKAVGYEALCTGPVVPKWHGNGPFVLRRIDVKRGLDIRTYARLAARNASAVAWNRSKEEFLFWSKKLLGFRAYEYGRRALLMCKAAVSDGAAPPIFSRLQTGKE